MVESTAWNHILELAWILSYFVIIKKNRHPWPNNFQIFTHIHIFTNNSLFVKIFVRVPDITSIRTTLSCDILENGEQYALKEFQDIAGNFELLSLISNSILMFVTYKVIMKFSFVYDTFRKSKKAKKATHE